MPKNQPHDETATADIVEIKFSGEVFFILKMQDEWPLDTSMALYQAVATNDSVDWVDFLKLILGVEQWNRAVALIRKSERQTGEFKELFEKIRAAINTECVA